MCVHRPAGCEGGIPRQPRSTLRQAGSAAQQSSVPRDSVGSKLICLLCWCYTCFIYAGGGSLRAHPFTCLLLRSSLPLLSSPSFRLSQNSFHFTRVIALWQCECVLWAREAESTVFNGRVTEDHTRERHTEFCGLKHSEA